MHLREAKVSIVKFPDYHQFKAVKTAVNQVTDFIGGLESQYGDHGI
jgi:hypothetical protein